MTMRRVVEILITAVGAALIGLAVWTICSAAAAAFSNLVLLMNNPPRYRSGHIEGIGLTIVMGLAGSGMKALLLFLFGRAFCRRAARFGKKYRPEDSNAQQENDA